MNALPLSSVRNLVVAVLCIAGAACTSLQPAASRPSPPISTSPAPSPSPTPAPPPSSRPLPPPNVPQSVPPASRSSTAPSRPQSDASGASDALLAQARDERAAGSLTQATASIERALRLDPNNAELWVERGELALQTGNTAQAGTMARKALSLAGTNSTVSARAQRLLQAASAR
ncbi:MAG: tetratricopeptide repeat protein [Gammaproteobacteria bacterium]